MTFESYNIAAIVCQTPGILPCRLLETASYPKSYGINKQFKYGNLPIKFSNLCISICDKHLFQNKIFGLLATMQE